MTTTSRARRWSALYVAMCVLIGIVITSIAVQIILGIGNHGDLARLIDPVTFGTLSAFFVVFGVYNGKKGKPVQSVGGYIAAGCWAVYTALLIVGVM